ncbi:MAG: LuxR C-terminal-related transcriptional regulator [Ornithinimicrobium sp.]|uniref:LuxR C-terminal-related transcriptional regulator n=1 Tax=Ornithinimicrobium sp. TaxID=1977084 RepID=UPI0026DF0382|nr:LuxR C-terminal-related transcriptional regulator [Ornithinimicrobium sp.]MDO5741264.1 LuxR C-terminal-related transcriptional regulator [Ornithinimicrobium sp.]
MAVDVVVIDARHCADAKAVQASIEAVTAAERFFLLVCPDDPRWDAVLDAGQSYEALKCVLRPWSVDVVRSILDASGLGDRDAEQVVELTGGLPWLIQHLGPSAEAEQAIAGRDALDGAEVTAFVLGLLDGCSPAVADTALAIAVGYPVAGHPALPGAPADDAAAQELLVRSVDSAGLLGADGTLPPLIRDCLIRYAPPHRLQRWREQLIEDMVRTGEDLGAVAADLVAQGVRDPRVVQALVERAVRAVDAQSPDHEHAARLLQLCLSVRDRDPRVQLALAHLGLVTGDIGGAARAIDQILLSGEVTVPPGLVPLGLEIACAQDLPHRAADLIRWVAARDPKAAAHPAVAISRYAVGDRRGADAILDRADVRQDSVDGYSQLLAQGVRTSIEDATASLPQLVLAVEASSAGSTSLTDSAVGLVALWGLHAGDLPLVHSVIRSAQHQGALGKIARQRLCLLSAWAAMSSGRLEEAESAISDVGDVAPRDRVWLTALRVGLARRADDPLALRSAWAAAREVVLRHPASLGQLLPLGELGLVAARMRDFDLVRAQWGDALALLRDLGEPPLWATPFHWYGVQVALQQDDPRALAPHASVLARAAQKWEHAAVLSAAARTWVRVRARDVDPDEVERTVRRMSVGGLAWDAARLAAHGAAATTDRHASARLLECARNTLPRSVVTASEVPHGVSHGVETEADVGLQLTQREWQVAELVVSGRTYKQVGEILYLSPKTIEHHVARIRRRSGAASRSELLHLLLMAVRQRDGGGPDAAPSRHGERRTAGVSYRHL